MAAPTVADVFALLQSGRAAEALALLERLDPALRTHPRMALARGLALRALGRHAESRAALESGARIAPDDYALAYELGIACESQGERESALAHHERASGLRATFAPARFAAGMLRFARGEWEPAIGHFRAVVQSNPQNVEARINLGLALAQAGRAEESLTALQSAQRMRADNPFAEHALGWALHKAGRVEEAVGHLERAVAVRRDVAWLLDLAMALSATTRVEETAAVFEEVAAAQPRAAHTLKAYGQWSVSRARFERAIELYQRLLELQPDDSAVAMYLAQLHLLRGERVRALPFYAQREPRREFERQRAASGRPYRVPTLAELDGKVSTVVAEQGLGDILFFLRFVPRLRESGARFRFAGEPRLHAMLARTGLFEGFAATIDEAPDGIAVLVGDLPEVAGFDLQPSLRIEPDPQRVSRISARLAQAGPRPWIGLTWRAGAAADQPSYALRKAVPPHRLLDALRGHGTLLALQRGSTAEELAEAASQVADLSPLVEDPEDALAMMSLLDRYVGVSNTNMHLAAACGATADVLVPFPPEWRWGLAGGSPWFPGFRVHRQPMDGDWSAAFSSLAASLAGGSTSRG